MKGIYAAIVTPVDRTGAIDLPRLAAHARWLLHHGCHGIGLFGTTGEATSFAVGERQRALEGLLAAGVAAERIILGIGCCACGDTVALARHGLACGVRRQLALPPFFYKNVSDEGVFRAFAEVIERLHDPSFELYLYHFPQMTAVPVTRRVLVRLLERFPGVVRGLKDSSGDWPHTLGLIQEFPDLLIYSGADTHLLDSLEAGGAGTISAAANLACAASRQVFDALRSGQLDRARAAMVQVTGVRTALQRHPLIPAVKAVIADGLGDPDWARVRPPLVALDPEALRELLRDLEAAGYRYDPDAYVVASA
jgi:4-hydroxy-tetrahydrodipicolinate synthase